MILNKKSAIFILFLYFIFRIYLASFSTFGFFHGWNETYYSLIAMHYGDFRVPLAYLDGDVFLSAPPLFSYMVWASFKIFGESDLSARLVSIVAEMVAVLGVYLIAEKLYDEKVGSVSVLVFVAIPWDVLWFGRAQTDGLMVALVTMAVAMYLRDKLMWFGLLMGLAVFTKQPSAGVVIVLAACGDWKKLSKGLAWMVIGLIPLAWWLSYYGWYGFNELFLGTFMVSFKESSAFADVGKVVAVTLFAISPIVLVSVIKSIRVERSILMMWLLIFGGFVILRTPPGHEYYSLILMPPIAILSGKWLNENRKWIMPMILTSVVTSYLLLGMSGDLGYRNTDIGKLDDLVFVPVKYTPQMVWYGNNSVYSIGNQSLDEIEKIGHGYLVIDEDDFRYAEAKLRYAEVDRKVYNAFTIINVPRELVVYKI